MANLIRCSSESFTILKIVRSGYNLFCIWATQILFFFPNYKLVRNLFKRVKNGYCMTWPKLLKMAKKKMRLFPTYMSLLSIHFLRRTELTSNLVVCHRFSLNRYSFQNRSRLVYLTLKHVRKY